MSSNDSTQPSDEGRTVATDAERADPAPSSTGAATPDGEDVAGADADTNGSTPASRPSPSPRGSEPGTGGEAPSPRADVAEPASAEPVQSGATAWGQGDAPAEPAAEPPSAGAAAARPEQVPGPPPWRRVPGDHPAEAEPEEAERPSVADSLLSEAPTAFLTAPSPGAGTSVATATATREQESAETPTVDGQPPRHSRHRPPRQALLQLKRLDPWSVLKMALALAVVLFLVWMVAAGVLYGVLGGMGVWDRLNGTYADLVTGQTQNASSLISPGRVFLLAGVVGAINSLLFAVALTIVAFVYNVAADLVGGIEVTLSERD